MNDIYSQRLAASITDDLQTMLDEYDCKKIKKCKDKRLAKAVRKSVREIERMIRRLEKFS